ncbi:MAG: proton-conducting transporter transmembrane domain-containing protein, partial [Methanosarcinales archaeon]
GLASKMPITAILWIMGAMMLSGLPPFSTFTAEWIMFTGVFQAGLQGSSTALIVAILAVSAVALTIAYTFWSVKRIFFGPLNPNLPNDNTRDPPALMWIPLILLAVVSIILGLYPKPMMDLFSLVTGGI